MATLDSLRAAYDAVASVYAERFLRELEHKPLDRAILDWFVGLARGAGRVADLGTGTGQIARYVHERGVDVFGVDLSPGMVSLARDLHRERGIEFRIGNLLVARSRGRLTGRRRRVLCVRSRSQSEARRCIHGAAACSPPRGACAAVVPRPRGDRPARRVARPPRGRRFSLLPHDGGRRGPRAERLRRGDAPRAEPVRAAGTPQHSRIRALARRSA